MLQLSYALDVVDRLVLWVSYSRYNDIHVDAFLNE